MLLATAESERLTPPQIIIFEPGYGRERYNTSQFSTIFSPSIPPSLSSPPPSANFQQPQQPIVRCQATNSRIIRAGGVKLSAKEMDRYPQDLKKMSIKITEKIQPRTDRIARVIPRIRHRLAAPACKPAKAHRTAKQAKDTVNMAKPRRKR